MNRGLTISMLKRLLAGHPGWDDVTLNMSSADPSDESLRASERYPFGPTAREDFGFTEEEQENLREDWITLRQAIREIEASPFTFVSLAVKKDNDDQITTRVEKL